MSQAETDEVPVSDSLIQPLRKLSEGLGVRSPSLHADLGPELRQLFHVPDWDSDGLRTLARVAWQLDRLINGQLVTDGLQQVARVSFNLDVPAIREKKLGERRKWLYETEHETGYGPSPSECQRDMRCTIIPAFIASLRHDPPPRPTDKAVAAVMAADTGRPASDYLPFPTREPQAAELLPDWPIIANHITIKGLIIIVTVPAAGLAVRRVRRHRRRRP